MLQTKYDEVTRTLKLKSDETSSLERLCSQKDEELSKLRKEIATYSQKINSLSDELDRLERNQRTQSQMRT